MPSVTELVYESSSDLKDRARNTDGVKVSLKWHEHVVALADEEIPEELIDSVLKANKPDLVEQASDLFDEPGTKTTDELQHTILEKELSSSGSGRSTGIFPDSQTNGSANKPDPALESHFDSQEVRQEALLQAKLQATKLADQQGVSYVVLESLRPKDASEPISVQAAHSGRHPDEIPVFEAIEPHTGSSLKNIQTNVYRLDKDGNHRQVE